MVTISEIKWRGADGNALDVLGTGNGYRIEWWSAPFTVDTIDWMKVADMKRYVEAQWILRR